MSERSRALRYIPFGAQYYRAPTPLPEDWANDLSQIRSLGMNTIKIWAQWRWNHPAEDRFDFDDLVELMDEAQRHGLGVVVNLILDCAPSWLFRKYPDCRLVTADGRSLGPVTTAYRQIGGVPGHCFHHSAAVQESVRFVEAAAKSLAGHPALAMWDLWNEPELTVGLLREPKLEDLVCFCDASRRAFLLWLELRYGTLDGLNGAWWRNYQSWDEVELPVQSHTYRDFIDWRLFFIHTMRDELVRRASAVRRFDAATPVMCHTVPPPIFHAASCASDDWLLAECGDLHGNSVGSDPFAADLLRSAAKGKPVINAEIHALGGSTFNRPHPIGMREAKRHILGPLARGIKGFLFWQYRPERLGAESPAWGLTNPDGSLSPWAADVSKLAKALLAEEQFLMEAELKPARVAILADPENQLFCFAGTLGPDVYARSIRGVYDALYRAGYNVDFVHPVDASEGALRGYQCIYLPVPYWVETGFAAAIEQYVADGGSVVSEIWPAAYDSAANLHSKVTPGMGLDRVFGVKEQMTWPEPSGFDAYKMWEQTELGGSGLSMRLEEEFGEELPGTAGGFRLAVSGYSIYEQERVRVLARLPDGTASIVENAFGKGRALLAGALLGYSATFEGGEGCAAIIRAAAERMIGGPEVGVSGEARADTMALHNRCLVVASSFSKRLQDVEVRLPEKWSAAAAAVPLTDDTPQAVVAGGALRTSLAPEAIEAWWCSV